MTRPALKQSIPFFAKDAAIHFRLGGNLTTLDDPDGSVQALLGLLDGTREINSVCAAVHDAYPNLALSDVAEAIADLDELRLLQDSDDQGEDFDEAAKTRWSNNFGFFETYASLATSKYEFQRRLRTAKVGVLGIGGIGSHVLIDLVAIGFEDIRIVDFDTVELSNFNRQILYGEPFVGRAKVEVATERAKQLNSAVRIDPVRRKLMSADDVYDVVHDLDVVIAVVDRPKMQVAHWLNEGCVRAGTILISGGVDTQRAMHYTIVPAISGCVECWLSSVRANDTTSRMVLDEMLEIDRAGGAFGEDTAAFNGLVLFDAGFLVAEMVRLTSRVSPPLSIGRMLEMSFHDPRLREAEAWKRDPDCPTCREAHPRPGLEWLESTAGSLPF